jgi:predicted neutral ceramidase superfamily lipid hydrolase
MQLNSQPSLSVTVKGIDNNTYQFKVSQWMFLNLLANIKGVIRAIDGKTVVSSQLRISLYILIVYLVSSIFMVIILFSYLNTKRYDLILGWVFGALFFIMSLVILNLLKNRLGRKIVKLLNPTI